MRQTTFKNLAGSTYMELRLSAQDRVDGLAMGMMNNNRIPGLLPVSSIQVDQERYLRYEVSGLTPLTQCYGTLSGERRLLDFVRTLCRCAQECEDYLMDADNLLLEPGSVFLRSSTGEFFAPYLPLEEKQASMAAPFLREVLRQLSSAMPADSHVAAVLSRALLAESISLSELDTQLANLQLAGATQADRSQTARPAPASAPAAAPNPPAPASVQPVPASVQPAPAPAAAPAPAVQPETPAGSTFLRKLLGGGKNDRKKEKIQPKKAAKIPEFGFAVPGAENSPAPTAPGQPAAAPVPPAPSVQPQPAPAPAVLPAPSPAPASPVQTGPAQQGHTVVLVDPQEKTTPTAPMPGTTSGEVQLYLVRRSTGERALIDHTNFHIGRDADVADFWINTPTVYMGTDHAYIQIVGGEYFISDNNSRNHTWLNGQKMESSRPYPLHSGDVVRMADETFDVVGG